jgi:hypothetical protein
MNTNASKFIIALLLWTVFVPVKLSAGNWREGTPLNIPRAGAASVVWDNFIYVFGGKTLNNTILNTVERFDPSTGMWETVKSFNITRYNASAVVFGDSIYLVGGRNASNDVLKKVEYYHPVHNEWYYAQEMRERREGHSVAVFNNRIYAIGGAKDDHSFVEEIEWYIDPTQDWEKAPFDIPEKRVEFYHAVVRDTFYMFGGIYYGLQNELFIKPPLDSVWLMGDTLQNPRAYGATAVLRDQIFIIGGQTYNGITETVEIYDTRTRNYTIGHPLPTARWGMTAVTLDSEIYVMGGFTSSNQPTGLVEIYGEPTPVIEPQEKPLVIQSAELQGFPNPFNGSINLNVQMYSSQFVNLDIYDIQGRLIQKIYSGIINQGTHRFVWNANATNERKVASGIYFATVRADNFTKSVKLFYVK